MGYLEDRASAAEAIRESGFLLTVTRSTEIGFDPETSKRSRQYQQRWQFYGIKSNIGKLVRSQPDSAFARAAASLASSGAALLLTEVLADYEPLPGDVLTFPDGAKWILERADGIDPGNVAIVYYLLVRN